MWPSVSWASYRSWTLKVSSSPSRRNRTGGRWCFLCRRECPTDRGAWRGLGQVLGKPWAQRGHGSRPGLCLAPALQLQLVPGTSSGLLGAQGSLWVLLSFMTYGPSSR